MSPKRSTSEEPVFDIKRLRTSTDAAQYQRVTTPVSAPPASTPDSPPVPRQERRRVNPEALALKLGPEVIADLQACITPGMTEMPSFEIRKRIQQRYNIDRRHIYDWFHNKGLRVTTSERREE